MYTVFWSCLLQTYDPQNTFTPTKPQFVSTLFQPLDAPVDFPRNALCPFVPSSLVYSCPKCASELSPLGLSFSTTTGAISGTPTRAKNAVVDILAHEVLTGDSVNISSVTITIAECGPETCLNGGVCIGGADAYDNVYSCLCTANYTGSQCQQFQSIVQTRSTDANSLTGSSIAIIAALSAFAAFLLIAGVIFIRHRRRDNADKPFDFETQMKELIARGLIADKNQKELKIPFEIKRKRVKTLEALGSGAFGDVHKVNINMGLNLLLLLL